jgi:hypothetical protein
VLGPLTIALLCRGFAGLEEFMKAVPTWIRSQPKTFFANGIRRFAKRYNISVDKKRGVIMLRNYTLLLSQVVVREVINKLTLFLTVHPSGRTMALGLTQSLIEMSKKE